MKTLIPVIQFYNGSNTYVVNDLNQFTYRHADGTVIRPSPSWTLLGAVEYKFGRISKRYSVADIVGNRVPWFWKNRHQRCFVLQHDHGSNSVQMSPGLVSVWLKDVGYVAHKYSTSPDRR